MFWISIAVLVNPETISLGNGPRTTNNGHDIFLLIVTEKDLIRPQDSLSGAA
jgi:hypothetical protein